MKLLDSNRYWLPGSQKRFLHIASVERGVHEYMCFANVENNQIYIEEITGGSLQFIEEDKLVEEIQFFLTYNGLLDLNKPLLSDNEWLRRRKTT